MKNPGWLLDNIDSVNIAEKLDDNTIGKIARRVVTGYNIDEVSRIEWRQKAEAGIKVAKQIAETKSYPWDGAANVKFPMIATAAIQFAARSYPNIVKGPDIVKAMVVGKDLDGQKAARAKRVSRHMSYQLLEGMPEWDEDTDKLLHGLPVFGTYFRKSFFDTLLQSTRSPSINPLNLVVNQGVKSLDTCRRISEKVMLYRNDVIERERAGVFLDKGAEYMQTHEDEDADELFLEQHCWLDLDEDGYEEPYIVMVHESTQTLVRITARYDHDSVELTEKNKIKRISPVQYYTKYDFIPDPEGMFYSLGFAHLLGPINESINTLINQLLDAGSMSNLQGGFLGKGVRFQGGAMRFKPGEWKPVEVTGGILRDNIFPLPVKDPSAVLFQLLGLLNDTGMKLASVSDTMAGETPSQNTPATTTLAVIEQGLKVFTAIYKRVFRSLKSEFKKIYRLNSLYLEEAEYFRIQDEENIIGSKDYALDDLDIVPVADPNLSTEAQRMARAQALYGTIEVNPVPEGRLALLTEFYESLGVDAVEKYLPPEALKKLFAPQEPPPDPQLIEMQLKAVKQQHDFGMESALNDAMVQKVVAEIAQLKANTEKLLAEAAAIPVATQLGVLKDAVAQLHAETKMEIELLKAQGGSNAKGNSGGSPAGGNAGMAAAPNNAQGAELPGASPVGPEGMPGGGADLANDLGGADGTGDELFAREDMGDRPVPGAAEPSQEQPV